MSIFRKLFGSNINQFFITNPIGSTEMDGMLFTTVDVADALGQYEAYLRTPIINTIIDKIAATASNTVAYVEDMEGVTQTDPTSKAVIEMLNNPNGTQNKTQFIQAYITDLKIYGEAFFIPIYLAGSTQQKGMIFLPKHSINVVMDYSTYPFQVTKSNNIKSISYKSPGGQLVDLNSIKDKIIVISEIQDKDRPGRGLSKFPSLRDHVNKYLIATNAGRDILQNYGAIGLWVNQGTDSIGTTPIDPVEAKNIKDVLDGYGLTSGKRKSHITSLNLKHEKVSLPLSDLMLDDAVLDSVRTICDSVGYPVELLSYEKKGGVGESGGREREFRQLLITENIMPAMAKLGEAMSQTMLDKNKKVVFYYDHHDAMQRSEKEKWEAVKLQTEAYKGLKDMGIVDDKQLIEIFKNLEIIPS